MSKETARRYEKLAGPPIQEPQPLPEMPETFTLRRPAPKVRSQAKRSTEGAKSGGRSGGWAGSHEAYQEGIHTVHYVNEIGKLLRASRMPIQRGMKAG